MARLDAPGLREGILRHLATLGFERVEIDPRGYRTGSLNEGVTPRG